ncbi:unnamed protein product, partial [marine sediment metagenome]
SLMRDGINVHDFKQALLDDDFGLVSLPRELWQERLGTPPLQFVLQPALPEKGVEDFAGE